MGHRKKRKKKSGGSDVVELNVMPFVDIFSLLTTFLLFSAVFVQIGILEVQVPFFSNAAPPPNEKPTRALSVKADLGKEKIEVTSSWSMKPKDPQTHKFTHDDAGIAEMHKKLVELRMSSPETDKLTFFVDDDVTYAEMAKVLDAIKLMEEGDPTINEPVKDGEIAAIVGGEVPAQYLYRKVVMGSVVL